MLQILHGTNVNFMKVRFAAYAFSGLLLVAGFVSMALKGGPRPGIDFAGGTLLELRFSQRVGPDDLRRAAGEAGLSGAEIQTIEGSNDALFRVHEAVVPVKNERGEIQSGPSARIQQALRTKYPDLTIEILRQEVVGAKVGRELRGKAALAVIASVIAIMIYVAWRFDRWEFGAGAALALFHDILVTLGVLSIINKEIGLTVLAAFLTIAGYSINDTIVVFDRVRENIGLKRRMSLFDLMNVSINQTLSRTILTVFTVLMTAGALFFLGGEVIHDFAMTMLIGVGFGTYSSIFVASALALDIDNMRLKRLSARAAARAQASAKGGAKAAAAGR
jgi:preprotein translocase subunit SecF